MSYVSIRTNTIRPGAELLFDLYVQYKDEYLKYRATHKVFEDDVLEKFKKKKIKKLFIPSEQEPEYLKYLDQALEALQEKSVPLEAKADFALNTLQQESDNIQKTLESEEGYRSSEKRINKVVDFMLSENKSLASMLSSAGLAVDSGQHGANVSSLCLGLGVASKYVGRDELMDLAVASLLHDSALEALGFDVRQSYDSLDKDQKKKYREHPKKAVEQVSGKQFITPRVLRLIQDHEEYGDGLGFPEKKRFAKLQVDSQIFNICDAFDHFALAANKTLPDCFADFVEKRADHFDMDLIQILETQIKA